MRSVSRRQKDKDPNAVCSVSSFTPRPMLRVGGGKDKGTRFLSFVDAMSGFRHLLTQEDIDKAASMCQGLKGHLSSRFIVISDDRPPPPPPTKKRPFVDESEDVSGKRFQNEQVAASGQSIPIHQFSAPIIYAPPVGQYPAQVGYRQENVVPSTGYYQAPTSHGYQTSQQAPVIHGYQTSQQAPVNQSYQTSHPGEILHSSQPSHNMPVTQAVVHHHPSLVHPTQSIFSPSAFPPLPDGHVTSVVGQQPEVSNNGYQTVRPPSGLPPDSDGQVITVVGQPPGDGFQLVRSSRRQTPKATGSVPGVRKIPPKRQSINDARAAAIIEEMEQDKQDQVAGSQSDSSFADATELS